MLDNMKRMLADISSEVHFTREYIGKEALNQRVMDVMAQVPRDVFVPDDIKSLAYDNCPLPIGFNQTISQPYIVALMTDLLAIQPEHRVLEIGTGCGYQTSVLSRLCSQVYSVERISELLMMAQQHFVQLEYDNIQIKLGNGYNGWPEYAPYDGILVTAAATHIPEALTTQLKPGGRMVIPIGLENMHQELFLLQKDNRNVVTVDSILPVAFVPLVGDPVLHYPDDTIH